MHKFWHHFNRPNRLRHHHMAKKIIRVYFPAQIFKFLRLKIDCHRDFASLSHLDSFRPKNRSS